MDWGHSISAAFFIEKLMKKIIAFALILMSSTAYGLSLSTGQKALITGAYTKAGDVITATGAVDISIIPAPVISGVAGSNITETGVTVAWTTDVTSDTQVEYGTTTSYGNSTTLNAALVTSHSQAITGLVGNVFYHYRVKSCNQYDVCAVSADGTFTTAAPPPSTAMLTGAVTNSTASVDLSAEGTTDWVHWGDTSITSMVRKSGVTAVIPNYVKVGTGTISLDSGDQRLMSWTGGTPTASSTNNSKGIVTSTLNTGFSLILPASTTQRTLKVYVGGYGPQTASMVAHLSDGSVPDYTFSDTGTTGLKYRNFTFNYKAASDGQTLTVTWKFVAAGSGTNNVTLYGAALVESTPPPPPSGPVLSAISASNITETGMKVNWTCDAVCSGFWEMGTTTAYGMTNAPGETSFNYSSHTQTVTGLTANTLYHYRIKAKNQAGIETVSGDNTFTTAGAPPPQGFVWGVDGHFWDQYGSMTPVQVANLIKSLGITTYRLDVNTSQYALVDALLAEGIEIVAILGGVNNDYNASFNEAVTFASRYLGQIHTYQASNERDVASGPVAGNGELPSDYDTAGYNAGKQTIDGLMDGIKSVDPTAKVMVNFTWLHYGFIQRLFDDGVTPDIIGIDWYWDDITAVQGSKNLPQIVKDAFGLPIWIAEGNRKDGSLNGAEQAQADYITTTATAMRANQNIAAYFVYELLDEPAHGTNTERFYGLMATPTVAKPAFNAYKNVINPPQSGYHAPAPTNPLVVNVLTTGATPNDGTNDTAAIQAAVNQVGGTGGTVLVPAGTYMIDALDSVDLKSSMTFKMDSGAVLKAMPNGATHYAMVNILNVTDVNVVGGTFEGERHEHTTPCDDVLLTSNPSNQNCYGQWGMGFWIGNATNLYIEGVTAREMWGDGFYVAGAYPQSHNVNFYSVIADDNRRQGASIENVDGMVIRDSVFKNTRGHWPMAGIDMEPYAAGQVVKNVQFIDNQFINNYSTGVKAYGSQPVQNILVKGNDTLGGFFGVYFNGAQSGVTVDGNTISNHTVDGIRIVESDAGIYKNNSITANPAMTGDKAGIRFSGGATGNTGMGNIISGYPFAVKDEVGGNTVQ